MTRPMTSAERDLASELAKARIAHQTAERRYADGHDTSQALRLHEARMDALHAVNRLACALGWAQRAAQEGWDAAHTALATPEDLSA